MRGATGQEFGVYCREKIFRPLGLDSGTFGGCDVEVRSRATYYEPDGVGARRSYERDELDEALSVLEHAIELAGDSPLAAQLRTTLQHYIDGDV